MLALMGCVTVGVLVKLVGESVCFHGGVHSLVTLRECPACGASRVISGSSVTLGWEVVFCLFLTQQTGGSVSACTTAISSSLLSWDNCWVSAGF